MATSVATPLETQFGQIPGLSQMTSVNVLGTSQITLQFDLSRSIDAAANDVLEAINAAGGQLPKDLPNPPTFRKTNPADAPILIMGVTSDTLPLPQVDSYAENVLAQQLSQVKGVAQVLVGGQQTPAVRVQVDPGKLSSLGLTLEDVRAVLANVTANGPKGTIRGGTRPTRSMPTTSAPRRANTTTPSSPIAGPGRSGSATWARRWTGRRTRELAAWQDNKPGRVADRVQAARRQRDRDGGRGRGQAAATAEEHPARHEGEGRLRPHADHPRLGQRRREDARPLDRAGGRW